MKLKDLDARMRAFETGRQATVPPGMFIVARVDGRGFSHLVREMFDGPYSETYRDHMVATTCELMRSGFHVLYAYTQGDEISLLLHRDESNFGRRLDKFNSVLAGIASAVFSLRIGTVACFDCRLSQLPHERFVASYFDWRARDGQRHALTSQCVWALRQTGAPPSEISAALHGASSKHKKKLAREHGIDFDSLPCWQRRGVSMYWKIYEKQLTDEDTGATRTVSRRRIEIDYALPCKDEHCAFIRNLVDESLGQTRTDL